jgi:hypothetical protein
MEENGKYKLTTEHRLTILESQLNTVMNNHLPHIQERVDKVNKKLTWLLALFVTNLFSAIGILAKLLLG